MDRMGEFNSDGHCIYYFGQETYRQNGVSLIVNETVRNSVFQCNLKNNRMISVHLKGKPLNITVIQVYAPITNAKEVEVEQFYEDLPTRPSRTNSKKRCSQHRGLKCEVSQKEKDKYSILTHIYGI